MKTRYSAVALGLSLVAASAALAQGWKPFTSKPGGFSILMPGSPRYEKRSLPSAAGQLSLNNFTASANGGATAYVVSYTDYPAAIVAKGNPEKMLAGARDGQLKNLQATTTSDKAITMGGNPGRDVQFKNAKGFTGRCKLVLVKSRLYQVLALTTNGSATTADFSRFIDSFKLN